MSLRYIIMFRVKQQKLAEFEKLMRQVKTDLPLVDGCLDVTILTRLDDCHRFTLLETWESKEKHQINSQKLVSSGDWDYILGLLADDPAGNYYCET